jgi:hypothetical protein
MDEVDNHWAAIIVHGIFGMPCDHAGKEMYAVDILGYRIHYAQHTTCLNQLVDGWFVARCIANKLAGNKRYAIANTSSHEYARPKCNRTKYSNRRSSKSRRKRGHVDIGRAMKTGDFNSDWDAGIHENRQSYWY